jgi:enoyl-CoA hydratase/carnithine racemase
LDAEVLGYAKILAAGPTASHAVGKELIRKYLTAGLDAADQHVLDVGMPLFETQDMQHGVETLVEHGVRNLAARSRFIGK